MDIRDKNSYNRFLKEIKSKISKSQYEALKTVNKQLINLYTEIGKMIHEKQEKFGWGKSVVENLAKDLKLEFPDIKGFSERNLWNMRQFYLEYKDDEKMQPLVAEISWTKNILIMSKIKDRLAREFYLKMTAKFGWTKSVLVNQLENKAYEKYLLNQTNFDDALPEKYQNQGKLAVKDEYIFNFLELGEAHNEKELERGLINNIREFLTEMGGYFSFMGSQYKLEVGDKEFYIDLLLYHRKLKSLVAVELKIGEFLPEYAGKMQFYLSLLDDKVKLEDENPSVGIIICKSKNRTIVEYALKNSQNPIGVSTYKITESLPMEYENLLPSQDEIIGKLEKLTDNLSRENHDND